MNSLGIGVLRIVSRFCRLVAKPNRSAASAARIGSHRPKMTAARAMKPRPAVMSLPNWGTETSVKYAPPIPAMAPASDTFQKRDVFTLMPTVSAAWGCSPTARSRRPHRVR